MILPRGIRNNNPGNIRRSAAVWQGQLAAVEDPSFVQFSTPVFGLRALMRLLLNYHLKYGLDTIDSILNRFAPPHENATDRYAFHVSKMMKRGRSQVLDLTARPTLISFARAIVRHENGAPPEGYPPFWYAPASYADAAELALQS